MAYIDVEIEDYLYEVSDDHLLKEMKSRIADGKWKPKAKPIEDGVEAWCPAGLASDIRAAFYARDASKLEWLLVVLENKEADDED